MTLGERRTNWAGCCRAERENPSTWLKRIKNLIKECSVFDERFLIFIVFPEERKVATPAVIKIIKLNFGKQFDIVVLLNRNSPHSMSVKDINHSLSSRANIYGLILQYWQV